MPNMMAMFIRTLATVGRSTTTAVGIRSINPSRTGRARKITSNGKEANLISSDHLNRDHRKRAAPIALLKLALIVPVAALTDLAVEVVPTIWTGKLRTDRVAIFPTSVSKTSNAAAPVAGILVVTALAAAAAIASVVAVEDSAAVIASAVEDLAAAVLEGSVAAVGLGAGAVDSGADDNNLGLGFACHFLYNQKLSQPTQTKHMKKLFILTNIVIAIVVLALITACQTTTSTTAQNEALLAKSGFKTVTVTTPKQQAAVSKLPQNTVSPVKYNGKTYYVYPTASNDKIYVGKQAHVNAAQQAYAAQQAQAQSSTSMNPPPTMQFQGHGQHGVVVDQFDGFGPMGVNALGDW